MQYPTLSQYIPDAKYNGTQFKYITQHNLPSAHYRYIALTQSTDSFLSGGRDDIGVRDKMV
jgi:hypothetical protein